MQTSSYGVYHAAYHHQDHDLKKRYLALLPPNQIIDIVLNFDLHVPPFIKSTVWPTDINAAIAAIQNQKSTNPDTQSLIQQQSEAQPPDKPKSPPPDTTQPSPAPQEPSSSTTPAPTPTPQQPPYPHQTYGYPQHPQAAYPHAPYYQAPPGYPPYPPYPYPTAYPQPHAPYPQPTTLTYAPPPVPHTQTQPQDPFSTNPSAADDLPSYEEMIVEALTEITDPEGCAPKDLFTWMASRYPLQQNFRPSASQALQKAFKRGRFQKSSGGKYRLNTAWEGGNTSRRTTRRPQTQNASSASPAPASPFTHAPLVHHNQQAQAPAFQTQPFGYSFQQQPPGFSSVAPAQPPQAQAQVHPVATTTTSPTTAADDANQATNSAQDAWEAAQNILKAINFDSLLALPGDDEKDMTAGAEQPAAGPSTSPALLPAFTSPVAVPSEAVLHVNGDAGLGHDQQQYAAGRAELQAQLALLAAQLAELSQEDEGDSVVHYPVVVPIAALPPVPTSAPAPTPASVHPTVPAPVSAPAASLAALNPPPVVALHPHTHPPPVMASLTPHYDVPMYAIPGSVAQQPMSVPPISNSGVPVPPQPQPQPHPQPHPQPPLPLSVQAIPEEEEDSEDDDDMEEVI